MQTVEIATRIAAPAADVWRLIASEEGLRELERGIVAAIDFEGSGVGAIRTLTLEGRDSRNRVRERLDRCDAESMEMQLSIIDTGDIVPLACHSGFAKVIPAGPSASILFLRTSFSPIGISDAEARALVANNHDLFTGNVVKAVGSRAVG